MIMEGEREGNVNQRENKVRFSFQFDQNKNKFPVQYNPSNKDEGVSERFSLKESSHLKVYL